MRLINKNTHQTIVEFADERVLFFNKFLENEMRFVGIPIPHGLRGVYHGKDCILLGDEDFKKAFKEVYYLTSMSPETFRWEG